MKTRAIKFFIPALAIVFAIAASAFTAIDKPMVGENASITGYYPNEDSQQPCDSKQVDCTIDGDNVCTISDVTYYRFNNGTSCQVELRKND